MYLRSFWLSSIVLFCFSFNQELTPQPASTHVGNKLLATADKIGRSALLGLANMIKHDLLITALAAYFLIHKEEHPYASALLTALWTGDFITFTAHHYGKENIDNSFIETLVENPFLTGLVLSGYFHQELVEAHPYISIGTVSWLAYSWADRFLT